MFDDITVANFPFALALTAVVVLVGVLEQVDVQLSVVLVNADLTETSIAFGTVSVVQPPPAPQIVNTVIVHGPHVFAAPGRYDLRVYGNGTYLAYKPIIIRQLQFPGTGTMPGAQP